jgi:glucosamine--fructose-6-phosphate aminotransferase (isomerizing)
MCGIVGYVGRRDGVSFLLEGLQQLEYRGYDSAGVAVLRNGQLKAHKVEGRIRDLQSTLPGRFAGAPGIAHTRWATHGAPSDRNAHPHLDATGTTAIVHNGILENGEALRRRLAEEGVDLASDTDSEVLAHLIARAEADDLEQAVRRALRQVDGAYGLAVLDKRWPDRIVVARNGSPVVLGIGEKEMYAASDVAALVRYTRQVVHLDDGELATVTADGFTTSTLDERVTSKEPQAVEGEAADYERGGFAHHMLKEIHEQPEAVEHTLGGRLDRRFASARLGGITLDARDLRAIRRVHILGCGSAYYAGLQGAGMIEQLARIPASAEPASEFRYRNPVVEADTLYVAVSQSGETADTLRAVDELRRRGAPVMGVVNVVGSSIARACGGGVYLHAGPEVAVASTKAVTCMSTAFALIALSLGRMRDLGPADGSRVLEGLAALPGQIREILAQEEAIAEIAHRFAGAQSAFFVGRAAGYPVALEGAQKLKEISYIHAEAYPASELKHGPLALVSPEVPSFVVLPDDALLDKNRSTVEQIRARGGPVVAVGHRVHAEADASLVVPRNEPELDPILLGIPLQLLSYHAALALGRDVDQPRNLAKSVTVE